MIKARFYIKKSDCGNDYRPVKWPIKYPYWCSGESDDSFILVVYAEDERISIFKHNRIIKFVGYQGEYNIGDSIKIVKVK